MIRTLAEADEALRHLALKRRGPNNGYRSHRAFIQAIEVNLAQGRIQRASQIFRSLEKMSTEPFLTNDDRGG